MGNMVHPGNTLRRFPGSISGNLPSDVYVNMLGCSRVNSGCWIRPEQASTNRFEGKEGDTIRYGSWSQEEITD
jgi:hypothetical protein